MSRHHSAEEEGQIASLSGTIALAQKLAGELFEHPCPFNKAQLREIATLLKAAGSIAKRASYWEGHAS